MKMKIICSSKRIDKEGDSHEDEKKLVNGHDYDSQWKHCGSCDSAIRSSPEMCFSFACRR